MQDKVMLSMESRMRGDMQVRFGAGMRKPTAERRQGVLYRAYGVNEAACFSRSVKKCISVFALLVAT